LLTELFCYHQICDGHPSNVREGFCGLFKFDVYELKCLCSNGMDETQAALCFAIGDYSSSAPTITRTITTTKTEAGPVQTATVWRTRTAPFAQITETAVAAGLVVVTQLDFIQTEITVTDHTVVRAHRSTSTAFNTITSFVTIPTTVSTRTTKIVEELDAVTVTEVDEQVITTVFTLPSRVYTTVTQTNVETARKTSTAFSTVLTTETDVFETTVPITASATTTVRFFASSVSPADATQH
jgi:hypothetical protein